MSSLDEDVVAKIKSVLFEAPRTISSRKSVLRPTVIRRRKVVAPQEPETPEPETVFCRSAGIPPGGSARETAPEAGNAQGPDREEAGDQETEACGIR